MGTNNILLCYPNRIDSATLLNGSWRAALPLSNVADPQYTKVARSTDATLASTQFDADFGQLRPLRLVALSNHNLTQAALWRVTLGTTLGGTDGYDSGWRAVWQMTFDNELLRWESPNWWFGTANDEYLRHPYAAVCPLADWYGGRYLRVQINDTANPDGYVQIGRAHACNGFEPTLNASYGLRDGWRDLSSTTRAESGALWTVGRRRLRTVQFMLDDTTLGEGRTLHEMLRSVGTVQEVFYVPQPSDLGACQQFGFCGRQLQLSPLEYQRWARRGLPVQIEEIT